jgi:hypothetical protein
MYTRIADLIVAGKREEIREFLTSKDIDQEKADSFINKAESIASYKQTLMSVYGIENPQFGVLVANIFDNHFETMLEAASEGVEKVPFHSRNGDRKQAKEMYKHLKLFYKGVLPYQICFLVSATPGGGALATVGFATPSSFASMINVEVAEKLLKISTIQFEPVMQTNKAQLPGTPSEITKARMEGIEFEGKNGRSTAEIEKISAIVLQRLLKAKTTFAGHLADASQTSLIVKISVIPNMSTPRIDFISMKQYYKEMVELTDLRLQYAMIKDSLSGDEDPEIIKHVKMAETIIAKCDERLVTPKKVLEIVESNLGHGFWGEHRLPVIVMYEDLCPHTPIWFALRVVENDTSTALYEEIERLDMLVLGDKIPEPPVARKYSDVVSDSG